jgi:hypothetical protein
MLMKLVALSTEARCFLPSQWMRAMVSDAGFFGAADSFRSPAGVSTADFLHPPPNASMSIANSADPIILKHIARQFVQNCPKRSKREDPPTKIQAPSTKIQRRSKLQAPNRCQVEISCLDLP